MSQGPTDHGDDVVISISKMSLSLLVPLILVCVVLSLVLIYAFWSACRRGPAVLYRVPQQNTGKARSSTRSNVPLKHSALPEAMDFSKIKHLNKVTESGGPPFLFPHTYHSPDDSIVSALTSVPIPWTPAPWLASEKYREGEVSQSYPNLVLATEPPNSRYDVGWVTTMANHDGTTGPAHMKPHCKYHDAVSMMSGRTTSPPLSRHEFTFKYTPSPPRNSVVTAALSQHFIDRTNSCPLDLDRMSQSRACDCQPIKQHVLHPSKLNNGMEPAGAAGNRLTPAAEYSAPVYDHSLTASNPSTIKNQTHRHNPAHMPVSSANHPSSINSLLSYLSQADQTLGQLQIIGASSSNNTSTLPNIGSCNTSDARTYSDLISSNLSMQVLADSCDTTRSRTGTTTASTLITEPNTVPLTRKVYKPMTRANTVNPSPLTIEPSSAGSSSSDMPFSIDHSNNPIPSITVTNYDDSNPPFCQTAPAALPDTHNRILDLSSGSPSRKEEEETSSDNEQETSSLLPQPHNDSSNKTDTLSVRESYISKAGSKRNTGSQRNTSQGKASIQNKVSQKEISKQRNFVQRDVNNNIQRNVDQQEASLQRNVPQRDASVQRMISQNDSTMQRNGNLGQTSMQRNITYRDASLQRNGNQNVTSLQRNGNHNFGSMQRNGNQNQASMQRNVTQRDSNFQRNFSHRKFTHPPPRNTTSPISQLINASAMSGEQFFYQPETTLAQPEVDGTLQQNPGNRTGPRTTPQLPRSASGKPLLKKKQYWV